MELNSLLLTFTGKEKQRAKDGKVLMVIQLFTCFCFLGREDWALAVLGERYCEGDE